MIYYTDTSFSETHNWVTDWQVSTYLFVEGRRRDVWCHYDDTAKTPNIQKIVQHIIYTDTVWLLKYNEWLWLYSAPRTATPLICLLSKGFPVYFHVTGDVCSFWRTAIRDKLFSEAGITNLFHFGSHLIVDKFFSQHTYLSQNIN
jgi:hypothetical protein